MFKISGLDNLSKTLDEAQKALEGISGQLGSVEFDSNDPASIQAAIQKVDNLIDERLGQYADNPIVGPLAESAKAHFRQAIIDKASASRLESGQV